jgi:hypothetical protein
MTRRRNTASAAALLAALLLAACSDSSGLTANKKQTISDFRAGADAVCAGANQAVADTRAVYATQFEGRTPTTDEAHDFLVRYVLPVVDKQVGGLHNLGEPTLDRTSWDDIMQQVDARLTTFKRGAESDPLRTLQSFNRPTTVKDSLQRQFETFGATQCAANA